MQNKNKAFNSAKPKDFIDIFMKTTQFGEFKWRREFSEFCIKPFVPELKVKCLGVKEKYKFNGKALNLRKWLAICIAENVVPLTGEEVPEVTDDMNGCYGSCKDGTKFIWIRSTLSLKNALPVAAHELAHHFLGHGKEPAVVVDKSKTLLDSYLEQPERFKGELQAELLAAMFLVKSLDD
jgi:hypothetical protein